MQYTPFDCPSVSVIIPMFNAEKYIAECLESLLAQTFKSFEVIIVDDCSTDSSCAIVESYRERFGGRLTLEKLPTNSGGGGYVPRNKGLMFSRGEYVFFADADDFLAENALEKLHTAAKNFDADVVCTGSHYSIDAAKKVRLTHDPEGLNLIRRGEADKPNLTVDDPNKNLQLLMFAGGFRAPWSKFVRRDFLMRNEIVFPEIVSGGDFIWTIKVFCYSKRFLRIPDALYFYREDSSDSVTRKKRSPDRQSLHWFDSFVQWTRALNEFSRTAEPLQKNPDYCLRAMYEHFYYCLHHSLQARVQISFNAMYGILQRGLSDESGILLPFLFGFIDSQQKNLILAQQHIAKLEAELKQFKS